MRAIAAIPIAIVLFAAPSFAASPRHVSAAKKAERRGEWRKALREWRAAYARNPNAEYLISIGDAYSHLGDRTKARKSYEAYLVDPLALPGSVDKVKARMSALDAPVRAPVAVALPLPPATVSAPTKRADPGVEATPPLPLSGHSPSAAAQPGTQTALPPPPEAPARKDAMATVEAVQVAPKVAMMAVPIPEKQAPVAAVSAAPLPAQLPSGSSRLQRTLGYMSAGIAVAALGGGALAFHEAGSTHGELTGRIHSPAQTQQLLDDERRYRTLTLVGLAAGVLAASVATALFVF